MVVSYWLFVISNRQLTTNNKQLITFIGLLDFRTRDLFH
jgi:hypothetical protein